MNFSCQNLSFLKTIAGMGNHSYTTCEKPKFNDISFTVYIINRNFFFVELNPFKSLWLKPCFTRSRKHSILLTDILLHDRPGALGEITLDTIGSRERKTKTLIIYLIINLLFAYLAYTDLI